MLKQYRVECKEIQSVYYTIEANNPKEAIEAVKNGEGDFMGEIEDAGDIERKSFKVRLDKDI